MRCVDVNVLVYAHRSDVPEHEAHRAWLDRARIAREPLGLADIVSSGFLRIVTHPRIFVDPTPIADALAFITALRATPSVVNVGPGERHWAIFAGLVSEVGARGNTIPDAYLASIAIEQGATWVTADRGFARFPGLRVEHPSAA
jgi:toxin-antitoxin system PIN domain toxin